MAIKNKKLTALLLAAAMMVGMTPGSTLFAAEIQDTEASADTAEAAGAENADAAGETVLEDGEVVMEGAVGKQDESQWITFED